MMGKVSHPEVTHIDSHRAQAYTKKHEVDPNESQSQRGAPNKPNSDTVRSSAKTLTIPAKSLKLASNSHIGRQQFDTPG
jgi:hypothetical protein